MFEVKSITYNVLYSNYSPSKISYKIPLNTSTSILIKLCLKIDRKIFLSLFSSLFAGYFLSSVQEEGEINFLISFTIAPLIFHEHTLPRRSEPRGTPTAVPLSPFPIKSPLVTE